MTELKKAKQLVITTESDSLGSKVVIDSGDSPFTAIEVFEIIRALTDGFIKGAKLQQVLEMEEIQIGRSH